MKDILIILKNLSLFMAYVMLIAIVGALGSDIIINNDSFIIIGIFAMVVWMLSKSLLEFEDI